MDQAERAAGDDAVYYQASVRHMREQSGGRPSTAWCIDCGEPIPDDRRRAMAALGLTCERCAECQTRFEKGT